MVRFKAHCLTFTAAFMRLHFYRVEGYGTPRVASMGFPLSLFAFYGLPDPVPDRNCFVITLHLPAKRKGGN